MKKLVIDQKVCIGCGTCSVLASKTFKMNDSLGKAEVIDPPGDDEKTIQEGIDSCAVMAITWSEDKKETK